MALPCSVVRDLLPTYAENMVENETKSLVEEHLAGCADCRKRLAGLKEESKPVETAAPLESLKKQLHRRRLRAVGMAALTVFIVLFAFYFRHDSSFPIPWEEGLVTVEGVQANKGLVLRFKRPIVATQSETVTDEDGSEIVIVQGMGIRSQQDIPLGSHTFELVFSPVPDRVIYGFEEPQQLLWGKPMNGGVEVLPRLALGFYLMLATGATGVLGALWLILRRRPVLRQLFFAPLSYLLAHLLLMGAQTYTFRLPETLGMILVAAAAIYGLLTLAWTEWKSRTE